MTPAGVTAISRGLSEAIPPVRLRAKTGNQILKTSSAPTASAYDCLCAGIIVADFLCAPIAAVPAAGGLQMTDAISLAIGGCASNVAADLAKIGRKSAVVGRVGADMPGRFVRDQLTAAGVDASRLAETPDLQTSSTLVINVPAKTGSFIHAFGASAAFDGSEIPLELIRQTHAVAVRRRLFSDDRPDVAQGYRIVPPGARRQCSHVAGRRHSRSDSLLARAATGAPLDRRLFSQRR